jgi:hypothetical protein
MCTNEKNVFTKLNPKKGRKVDWPIRPELVEQVDKSRDEYLKYLFGDWSHTSDEYYETKIEQKTDEYFENLNKRRRNDLT